jgi:hypothetical protein
MTTPAPAPTAIDLAAILQQNQDVMRLVTAAVNSATVQPHAPTDTIAGEYDINDPPPTGKDPEFVRHNAALNFAQHTMEVPVHAWLNSMAAFCILHKTNAPAFLASGYLLGYAAAWFHSTFADKNMYKVSWKAFSSAILDSYLIDPTADQTLLNRCKTLSQGTLSIKDYLNEANAIYQNRTTHPFLKSYPDHFFIEAFRSGLHSEIQSRLPAVTATTTFLSFTVLALHIATPLEDDSDEIDDTTHLTPKQAHWGRMLQGWESYGDLSPEQRRWARTQRGAFTNLESGACTYCSHPSHLRDACPERANDLAHSSN